MLVIKNKEALYIKLFAYIRLLVQSWRSKIPNKALRQVYLGYTRVLLDTLNTYRNTENAGTE